MSTPLARVAPLDRPRMSTTLGRVVPKDRYSKDPLNSAFNQAQYPRALCSSQ
jgi:hypothetical protein